MNLIPRIDRLLEARSENGSEKGDGTRDYFYVSEVDSCPRALFYKMKGYPKEPFTPTTYRKLDNGDYVHRRIMSMLLSLGIVVAAEIRIPEDKIFHGRADAIVSIDDELYVLEIKSANKYAFEKMDRPDPAHLKQVQLYMHYFKIDRGIILVENKNDQELKEFTVHRDEKLLSEISHTFQNLKEMVSTNTIPPKPNYGRSDKWRCDYCAFRETCKKDG